MKTFATLLILSTLTIFNGYSQAQITLQGDPNDSSIIKQKAAFEARGLTVVVKAPEENAVGDQSFIEKYTNATLPSFSFVDLEGNTVSSEDLKGKKVHINFWSTTCKPCIEEFPELNRLKEQYGTDEYVFLAFAPESTAKVEKVINKHSFNYTLIAEAKTFYEQLGIKGYPKNFFIDESGKIVKVTDGTNYRGVKQNGEMVLVPDNFKVYNEILQKM